VKRHNKKKAISTEIWEFHVNVEKLSKAGLVLVGHTNVLTFRKLLGLKVTSM